VLTAAVACKIIFWDFMRVPHTLLKILPDPMDVAKEEVETEVKSRRHLLPELLLLPLVEEGVAVIVAVIVAVVAAAAAAAAAAANARMGLVYQCRRP